MGAIYASAKMTIVCTDGDAMAGILILKNISPPRDVQQEIFPALDGGKILVGELPSLEHEHGCAPYFERGWRFQEFLFSKRRLISGQKQLHWKCACVNWHRTDARSKTTHLKRGQPPWSVLCRFGSQTLTE
ncbi:hypothetical protein BD289DRAFT_238605 [Coniella lustricola]|uniref:Heterokaryon incompatibility domain-containing protein n=1 Tax=Coniella lustricola TaxID=2025994 RepID=A0A2T3AL45_9PEZI|nr:hypothetical protein BD289DRAFT_238605 [Coniella lustricola]